MNALTLVFQSDNSITGRGFKANYSTIVSSCGGIIKKLGHTIIPPMNEDSYKHESDCTWVIVAPVDSVVQLTFNSFELESSGSCYYDYVQIFEGLSKDGSLVGKFCGTNTPPVVTSNGNILTIKFKSDFNNGGSGFSATYSYINSRTCKKFRLK